ncbi:MAG TPA: cysteine desulfurase family protein [Saprospiraceae bacterium]|nr:cysteine desulfurase family protein [Saprospiraceae bacterium]
MKQRIYLDNAATTALHPEVAQTMYETSISIFGNPSSIHQDGVRARNLIEESRRKISDILHCSPGQIYFTSGGTEANNMILRSVIELQQIKTVYTTYIEHPCILNPLSELQKKFNFKIQFISVTNAGIIDYEELESKLSNDHEKKLVSLMQLNNELGSVHDLSIIAKICKLHSAYFHSDTTQSIGLMPMNAEELGIDFFCGSAHKFHGPKGIGFVYFKEPGLHQALIHGGGQERNMRSGTENTIGIAGLTKALELIHQNKNSILTHLEFLNQYCKQQLSQHFPQLEFFGTKETTHPKILTFHCPSFSGIEMLLINLDIHGISVSGGSACSSGAEKKSHVMQQLKPDSDGRSIRISFAYNNTKVEIDQLILVLKKLLPNQE